MMEIIIIILLCRGYCNNNNFFINHYRKRARKSHLQCIVNLIRWSYFYFTIVIKCIVYTSGRDTYNSYIFFFQLEIL